MIYPEREENKMLKILSQHTKPKAIWIWENDTLEDIYYKLEVEHDIRPDFEEYGNHINYNPKWINAEAEEKYKGCVVIFTSPYIRLITDDNRIIERCENAVNVFKKTEEYKRSRTEYLELEAEKERERKERIKQLNNKSKRA